MAKLRKVLNHLNKVKDEYEELRSHIADDCIDRALEDIEKLKELRGVIEYLENLEVVVKEEELKMLEEE